MASTNTTNMNLILPTVGREPGPTWASDLNASLTLVDRHNHTSGNGVAIPVDGLNINGDLPFANNNVTNLKSARFFVQSAVLSGGSDLGCLYVTGVDLYFNDVNGNQIRMTQSGGISGTSGSIGSLVAPASATYVSGTPAFVFQSAASTPASLDGGSVILRNILASSKGLTLAPPNAMAADYTLTLPSLPAQTNVMTLGSSGTIGSTTYDAVGQAMTPTGANAIAATRTRTTGSSSVALGGVAISSSSGAFATASTTAVDVTNLSVTLVTSGRPVMILMIADPAAPSPSYIGLDTNGLSVTSVVGNIQIVQSGLAIAEYALNSTTNSSGSLVFSSIAPGVISYVDTAAASGSNSYKIKAYSVGGKVISVNYCALVVYEL